MLCLKFKCNILDLANLPLLNNINRSFTISTCNQPCKSGKLLIKKVYEDEDKLFRIKVNSIDYEVMIFLLKLQLINIILF